MQACAGVPPQRELGAASGGAALVRGAAAANALRAQRGHKHVAGSDYEVGVGIVAPVVALRLSRLGEHSSWRGGKAAREGAVAGLAALVGGKQTDGERMNHLGGYGGMGSDRRRTNADASAVCQHVAPAVLVSWTVGKRGRLQCLPPRRELSTRSRTRLAPSSEKCGSSSQTSLSLRLPLTAPISSRRSIR